MAVLDHIAITVMDLARSVDFYSGVLGFPVLRVREKPELNVTYALLQAGQVNLEIISPLKGKPSHQKQVGEAIEGLVAKLCGVTGLNHLSIRVEALEKTLEELKGKGANFLVKGGPKQAFLTDPEGNLIELVERS